MKLLDSSVLILFSIEINEIQIWNKLVEIGESLIIPISVYREILNANTKNAIDTLIHQGVLSVVNELNIEIEEFVRNRYPSLGIGEINVLTLGIEMKSKLDDFHCVFDEKPARKAAEKLGLPVTGSIGLLKLMRKHGKLHINEIKTIVTKIKNSPFRISNDLLMELLDE